MEKTFETIRTQSTSQGRFTIVQDLVKVNDKIMNYDYLKVNEGVCILAVYDGKIVVQKQYRYPLKSWQWELPGGFIDPGETPRTAAIRELKEETGYTCAKIESLGHFYPSFGSTDEKIHLFLAQCQFKETVAVEPGEIIEEFLMTKEELQKLICRNRFCHGAGLAAWARYMVRDDD